MKWQWLTAWRRFFFQRQELKLDINYPVLVIFDQFWGQCTENIFTLLEAKHVLVVVPANCTDRLQPLDVSMKKAAKDFLQSQFQEWYSEQICKQLHGNKSATLPVDLWMSIVKPLGAKWMIRLYDYMKSKPDITRNGFQHAGITFL